MLEVFGMLLCSLTFNNDVIHIDFHILPNLILQHMVHQQLVCGSSIFYSEGHDCITIETFMCNEGRLFFIFLPHWDLVVPLSGVNETIKPMTSCGVYQLINYW